MKPACLVLGCLFCIAFVTVIPVQAFTAKTLSITVKGNGDAQMDMQYDLTLTERAAIFFHFADPSSELQTVLSENFNQPVTVVRADSSSAEVIIPSFASVAQSGSITTTTTPSLSFARAEEIMNQYWFASLISPHLSPRLTTVTFADGYQTSFWNQISIPSVSHQIVA